MSTTLPSVSGQITCVVCGRQREMPLARSGRPRTPRRWKVLGGQAYCPLHVAHHYVLRFVVIPIAGPASGTWADFRNTLRELWAETTRCANWMITTLYASDVRRQPDDKKLQAMPRTYLYPEARRLFPTLPSNCIVALAHRIDGLYRAQRYELLWTRQRTLATLRYPVPYPVAAKTWCLERSKEGAWYVSLPVAGGRQKLRLRGGQQYARQVAALEQLANGNAIGGGLSVYEIPAHRGDHRPQSGPGARVVVSIAAYLPKRPASTGTETMRVCTNRDALLTAFIGDRVWTYHADQIRSAYSTERRRRHRLAADLTQEMRSPARLRRRRLAPLSRHSATSRQRLATWIHQATAAVVGYALRQRIGAVIYEDEDRGFVPSFPWFDLETALRTKFAEAGLSYMHRSGSALIGAENPAPDSLSGKP